jgi:hypothetical protein
MFSQLALALAVAVVAVIVNESVSPAKLDTVSSRPFTSPDAYRVAILGGSGSVGTFLTNHASKHDKVCIYVYAQLSLSLSMCVSISCRSLLH